MLLYLTIGFFSLAALLGLYLLSYILQNKNTPKGVAFTHGPLAAIGLILLIFYAIFYQPAAFISVIIFILAALGGIVLILTDLTGKPIPKWMALGHGLTAIIGFLLLIVIAFYQ